MTTAVSELLVRLDATTESLRREMAKADRTTSQAAQRIDSHLAKVDKRFAALDKAAGLATKALTGYVAALSVGAVVSFANRQLEAADAIGKMADITNLSTAALQELRYAFTSLAKVSDGEVDAALRRFNRRLGLAREGAGPAKAAFEKMFGGVKQFGTTEQALDAVIARLGSMEDASRRAALASAYFGDDAGPLLAAALGQGSGAINQLRKDANDLGLVLDREVIDNAAQIRDDFDKASRILNTSFMRALNEAAPLLLAMANSAARIASGLSFGFSEEGKLYKELQAITSEYQALEASRRKLGENFIGEVYGGLFGSNEEVDAEIARLKVQADSISLLIDELGAKQREAAAGGPIAVSIAYPARLADLEREVEQQRQLNDALLEGEDAHRRMADAIERQNAADKFAAELAKAGIEDGERYVKQFEAQYAALQGLKHAQAEHNKLLAEAARVKKSVLSATDTLNAELDTLDTLLEKNLISWQEYAAAVVEAEAAIKGATDPKLIEQLKQIELAVQGFGRNFEDALIDAAKGGEKAFSNMVSAILEDIARLVIRMQIIQPLAGAINTGINNAFGNTTANADGNAFSGGRVIPFARGGVVTGPTLFPMRDGTGLMGEAGPEAIMPLKRGPDGKLGVAAGGGGGGAVVQIIDQRSGGEAPQVEQSRGPDGRQMIRVLIRDEMQAAIGSGAMDRTMANTYGLRRRGA